VGGLGLVEADARILDGDNGPGTIVEDLASRANHEPAALGRELAHGVGGVEEEVEEDLLELNPIPQDRRQVRGQRHLEGDAVTAELGTDDGQHVADDLGEVAGCRATTERASGARIL
jgi:hypothetical protein